MNLQQLKENSQDRRISSDTMKLYTNQVKMHAYGLRTITILVEMLMMTKILSNSVHSAISNIIQQVPQMNSMMPIQHVERVCG